MDMLQNTFSTFHILNILLSQQYREKGFTEYSGLISCLLVAEQNNELLMKIMNPDQLEQHHFLKRMLSFLIVNELVVVVVVEIKTVKEE